MRNSILVLTNSGDKSVDCVIDILRNRKEKVFRFNVDDFPQRAVLSASLENNSPSAEITITTEEWTLNTASIKSCWHRHAGDPQPKTDAPEAVKKFVQKESKAALWSVYTTIENAFWMNHPLVGIKLLESNKLFQLRAASLCGLEIPDTLISNSGMEVVEFSKLHSDEIAAKVLTGHIFINPKTEGISTIYTRKITTNELEQSEQSISASPVFIEEYVPKSIELRITIVGKKIFACSIDSQSSPRTKDDWRRYDFEKVAHKEYKLPDYIQKALLKLMRTLNLAYGAVDMVLTPAGKYVFLEINPSGQWGWIEDFTGMKISEAIANRLIKG